MSFQQPNFARAIGQLTAHPFHTLLAFGNIVLDGVNVNAFSHAH